MTEKTNNERDVIEVPLGNHATPAKVFRQSLEALEMAGITGAWFVCDDGQGRQYVRVKHKGTVASVARLITGAPKNHWVSFRNGTRLDPRLSNLKITKVKTKERK
jgi:hypothetical protein